MPARQAFVPELIPQPLIFTAMALNTTGWNLSRIVGPALAGVLIAWLAGGDKQSAFGVGVVYLVIAALYLSSALTTLLVDVPGKSAQIQSSGTYNEMREGLAYVFAHPRVFALLLMSIIPFLFGMPLNTLLPAFNQDVLGGMQTAWDFGVGHGWWRHSGLHDDGDHGGHETKGHVVRDQ